MNLVRRISINSTADRKRCRFRVEPRVRTAKVRRGQRRTSPFSIVDPAGT